MKKNITDRTIDAVSDILNGMPAEMAAMIHDVPYEPLKITPEKQKAIDDFNRVYNKLTKEEKADLIDVDGKKYIRKIWEMKHSEEQ